MKSVAVLMSVFNGREYISEQIYSILSQECVAVFLYIRDDGSDESTSKLLDEFALANSNVYVTHGLNIGILSSFMEILKYVPTSHDYYAFSDADDVFLPRKLIAAVSVIEASNYAGPLAYCGQVTFTDSKLNIIGEGRALRIPIALGNAVLECRMSGATAVFNNQLHLIMRGLDHKRAVMHDAWLNLVACTFGNVIFDTSSHMYYRQHGRNADGGRKSSIRRWKDRAGRSAMFLRFLQQARSLLSQLPSDTPEDRRELLQAFVDYSQIGRLPLRFLYDSSFYYQNRWSKLLTFIAIRTNLK